MEKIENTKQLEKLYEEYGRLAIEAEIVNSKLMAVKKKIADELNKQPVEPKEA